MTGGERFYPTDVSKQIFERTVGMGYQVSKLKGYTNYGIALATMQILDSIVYDLRHTMPLSVLIDGFCDVSQVCLSLPAVIGRSGVTRVVRPQLSVEEQIAFRRCGESVRQTISQMHASE